MRPNALAAVVLGLVVHVFSSSQAPRPLKRIDHPLTFEFAEHALPPAPNKRWSVASSRPPARLTVRAFDSIYHLHLSPNNLLLHPQARINYYSSLGEIVRSEPFTQDDAGLQVYEGVVVKSESTDRRWKEDRIGGVLEGGAVDRKDEELGWARITVKDGGESYEGAFTVKGAGVHHIQTTSNYMRHRHDADPHPNPDADNGHIVIFRDGDRHGVEYTTSQQPQSCSHDALRYNTDPSLNKILDPFSYLTEQPSPPWYDPRHTDLSPYDSMDLDARFVPSSSLSHSNLAKRQNNDISGGGNMTSNFVNSIGSKTGCPTSQSIVYLGVAADCRYVQFYGGSANATTQILNDFNAATSLYKSTFSISLGIVELAVMDETCPSNDTATTSSTPWNIDCSTDITLNDRLSLFSQWRGAKGDADGAGLWHLMSGCPTGTEVGVAWLGVLCETESSGSTGNIVSGTAVTTATQTEWQVISHEIGHNFGAIHDCSSGCSLSGGCCPSSASTCADTTQFIMDATTYNTEQTFSPCTLGNICTALTTMNNTCVKPADGTLATISLQMCGNGIVEAGEDCDPGKNVTSSCCDSATCKFTSGALCDPKSSACCTDSCQFAPTTQVCRPSKDARCDYAESCTGSSSACPADLTQKDGTSCGSGLACASGTCTSPSLQCQTVGASLNLSKACPQPGDKSCQVSCQDPTASNQCVVLQASLVNGSPCGYGGTCQNMTCKAGSFSALVSSWYRQNLQIAIPVTIAAALVVLMMLWRIVQGCIRASRRRKAMGSGAYAAGARPAGGRAGAVKLNSWASGGAPTDLGMPEQQYGYPPPQGLPPQDNAYPPKRAASSGYVYTPPGTSYPPYHGDETDSRNDFSQPPPRDEYANPFGDSRRDNAGGQWDDRQGGGRYGR